MGNKNSRRRSDLPGVLIKISMLGKVGGSWWMSSLTTVTLSVKQISRRVS